MIGKTRKAPIKNRKAPQIKKDEFVFHGAINSPPIQARQDLKDAVAGAETFHAKANSGSSIGSLRADQTGDRQQAIANASCVDNHAGES